MRHFNLKSFFSILTVSLLGLSLTSCNTDDNETTPVLIDPTEKADLLFILEEEKMARDVYSHLFDLYGSNQFDNIKSSEQRHMNYVQGLLDTRNIEYEILAAGSFNNKEIQNLYDQLISQGEIGLEDAFMVGATIEDVDIYDLQQIIERSSSSDIITVMEKLRCGSMNHMRAFTKGLDNLNATYIPQYIRLEEYEDIVNGSNQHCG
ncbi:MAG: DUF2202 domain-containing protein [Bacteroidia bacterium]|nr:DUF2202 domain-containing protein [Bacteroidia bacterium]